ncbi:TadE/TadG family type IV pilus assembly protein [Roseicyclus persicicus]|uniref:Pilus assembly protein n=1 Tax=Roseicyclus persicicus TaxID=2650661 RepID=A0A7X6GVJ7_9RHOB|nr:TadE/TadG family type IV pilus assembly protein [Roseibacterium persicicum]NKX43191.1 pilus assembly protein [Roseibacterium persicicum]
MARVSPRAASGSFLRDTGGAVAVEFALVFGCLILLVFGVFEFGRAIYYGNAVEVLGDQAARFSILSDDCALSQDAEAVLRGNGFGVIGQALTIVPASGANGHVLSLDYTFDLIVPIYGDSTVTVSATRDLSGFCTDP